MIAGNPAADIRETFRSFEAAKDGSKRVLSEYAKVIVSKR